MQWIRSASLHCINTLVRNGTHSLLPCNIYKKKTFLQYVLHINRAPRHEGVLESGGMTTHFFTSALDGGEWSASRPGRYTPRERAPGTLWIGGWVDPTYLKQNHVYISPVTKNLHVFKPHTCQKIFSCWQNEAKSLINMRHLRFSHR
jgi:hypothetical protein